jgi:excisionase family DNA binding protein
MRTELLTVPEAAAALRLSEKTVRNWLSLRKITYVKVGGRTMIKRADIDRMIEQAIVPALYRATVTLTKRCGCSDPCRHSWHYQFKLRRLIHRGTTRTSNRQLAERIAHQKRTKAIERMEGVAEIPDVLLSKHVETYLAHTEKTNLTSYKDRAVLDALRDVVGADRPIREITSFHVERWKQTRLKDVSRSTVNREFNIIRGCFSFAVKGKLLREPPVSDVDPYRTDDTRRRVLTDDELKSVLAIEDPFVADVCRATLETLSRISELLALRREHIGASWIECRVKGGKVQRKRITPNLKARLLARCHENGYVFADSDGTVPTQQTATNRVLRALQAAGIEDASHHTMRHTGVTLMLERGAHPRVIQKFAGWTSLRMLERYGHVRDAAEQQATTAIESHLDGITKRITPDQAQSAK